MRKAAKTLSITLCLLMLLSLLMGCGGPTWTNDKTSAEPLSKSEPYIAPETLSGGPESAIALDALPDDPYSFTLILDGETYTLPASFAKFAANGWTIQMVLGDGSSSKTAALDREFTGKTYHLYDDGYRVLPSPFQGVTAAIVERGTHRIYMDFLGMMMDEDALRRGTVVNVWLFDSVILGGTGLFFPGGITLGSPLQDILTTYGEPTYRYDASDYLYLSYATGYEEQISFEIDEKTALVKTLSMTKIYEYEAPPYTAGDMPAVVANYQAPSALGGLLDSHTLRYDGTLYQLPVPVCELVAHDWIFVSYEGNMIDANSDHLFFVMRKENQILRVTLHNYADTPQPAFYCFVTTIVYGEGIRIPLELPGGLTEASSVEDFVEAYGEPVNIYEIGLSTSYRWESSGVYLEFDVDRETGVTVAISLKYQPDSL